MSLPQVSVIVPAYNAELWIETSLSSLLGQSLPDWEGIVVDDGSSDGTVDIVRGFDDSRIRLVSQENKGQCTALNRGVAESRGNYLKFLDADDWLNQEHLASQLRAVTGADNCVASCRWGYFVDDPEFPLVKTEATDRDYGDPLEWLVDSLTLDEGMMGGWKWLIPRTVWNRCGGWDERLSLNNDFDFSIRVLLAANGVKFSPEAVYSYRKIASGSLSGSSGRRAMESAFLTTELGCRAMLAREDSPRIRKICADRWQLWLHRFFPEFPDLAGKAEVEVSRLGGSDIRLQGGRLLNLLMPVLGWKAVRRIQTLVRKFGWNGILSRKAKARVGRLANQGAKGGG